MYDLFQNSIGYVVIGLVIFVIVRAVLNLTPEDFEGE